MLIKTSEIIKKADEVIENCNSRDPYIIAESLGIEVMERNFTKQLGVYQPVLGVPFIFIKADLEANLMRIVLLHEIAHHILHKEEAENGSVFLESELFNLNNRFEYEANIFAAHISLPDDEFLDCIKLGYNAQQIAEFLSSNINLVALKVDILNQKGYKLHKQFFNKKFLQS